jgi:hypothetical protein
MCQQVGLWVLDAHLRRMRGRGQKLINKCIFKTNNATPSGGTGEE